MPNTSKQGKTYPSDKKQVFSIRSLKVGVASIAIASSFFVTGMVSNTLVLAEDKTENTQLVTTEVTDKTDLPVSEEDLSVDDQVNKDIAVSDNLLESTTSLPSNDSQALLEDGSDIISKDSVEVANQEAAVQENRLDDTILPVAVAQTESQATPAIEAGHVRLHFEGLEADNVEQNALWLWGSVEKPSENWPNGATSFSANQVDDFGHYVDLKTSDNPSTIGYLLLKNGEKVVDADQKVELLTPNMTEAWITKNLDVYPYQPLADENTLRINYYRKDNNYDGWGVWLWGDTEASSDWPNGALDFKDTGSYGRYLDIPLSKGLSSQIGFLLVNQNNPELPGNKTKDFAFSNREKHSQLFLNDASSDVYTNPYFIADKPMLDTEKAVPGTANITVQATVNRSFNYNENAIVSLTVTNPDQVEIAKMEIDTSLIGGKKIPISTELNKVTITATSDITPGNYDLPIRVYDKDNGYYDTTVSVEVTKRNKAANEKDWDEQIIYFMLTDRFYNGDKTNDNPNQIDTTSVKNQAGLYQGGDFKGITEKLDYLKDLGVSSIWITPIVENIETDAGTKEDGEYYAYHGYWASRFEALNPHLGSLADFHELIDKAAEKNINIIVDVVLNHAGYGAQDNFKGLIRSPEETKDGDDERGSLAGLPDFKTEDMAVRDQLVSWQSSWLDRSTTAKGNSIYAFRVDTVKHVDDTTWQHFKNALAQKDVDFHLIGESWGANYQDTKGDLGVGTMDSLLDFGFKDIAKFLVNGHLKAANKELMQRNATLTSSATLGQFLGSHDEDGFLYSVGGDTNKLKLAATMLITAKGQPVIYYGEELGQSGANNWPIYDNRYLFDWENTKNNDVLAHYKKVLAFRNAHSETLSRGTNEELGGSDSQQWLLTKRSYKDDSVYVLYATGADNKEIKLEVSAADTMITDDYSGKTHSSLAEDGKFFVYVTIPSLKEGGTMLLRTDNGEILSSSAVTKTQEPIEEGYFRVHFKKLPSDNLSSLGLWIWDDVETPSSDNGAWPTGAINFSTAKEDDYGYYLDLKMSSGNRNKISLLINNTAGDNITGDKTIELIASKMNEAWFDDDYNYQLYEPLQEGYLRINYFRTDGQYDQKSLWIWGDVETKPGEITQWPDGIDFEQTGNYGRYIDIKLTDLPKELGFLLIDESKSGDDVKIQPNDYKLSLMKGQTQIFVKDSDPTIYTNPYFVNNTRMIGAQHTGLNTIETIFNTLDGVTKEDLMKDITVSDASNQTVSLSDILIDEKTKIVTLMGEFPQTSAPYTIHFGDDDFKTAMNWQLKDSIYRYDGPLGAQVKEDGRVIEMTFWSPSADAVDVVVYDKDNQAKIVGKVAMTKGDLGQWHTQLKADTELNISDYRGYYYHYEITRGQEKVLVLDPYAKSLAAWNSELADTDPSYRVAKAAFVDPSQVGPKELTFAQIDGFKTREDAIIYEAHVRDFTSDESIAKGLKHQFGTFSAFIEKLDYLKDLGVTHVQLLPVMSYYFANESENGKRLTNYASSDTNYNWGYDPQSYFALTGMYSETPTNPLARIAEFKELVNEIHKRGMGVILDVVYNHTAKIFIFEDLEPNYYHFMDANGTPRTSFGGGRLGTTHHMSQRVLVDSIKYLVDEFKIDGFRFDMMGDHDAESIEKAYLEAKKINPNIIMLGEGWLTFVGDENKAQQAADQTWMNQTDTVAVFSDDIRNLLKSGFPSEGQPAFITNGAKNIEQLFNNIKALPGNFTADSPGDVIQYIAAHDNLTLFDIIAQSIKKDPAIAENLQEIHKRLRIGNLLVLTSQGTPFIHSGQEYGRTKQFLGVGYEKPVADDKVPSKAHLLVDEQGNPFKYPYFIHDSYDSTDAINRFDWQKATDKEAYPEHTLSQAYTKGLIALRRSTDAFNLKTMAEINKNVSLISQPNQNGINTDDLVIAYQTIASNGEVYAVFINADTKERQFVLSDAYKPLLEADIIVDGQMAGITPISQPFGVNKTADAVHLAPLTATVFRLKATPQAEQELTIELTYEDGTPFVKELIKGRSHSPIEKRVYEAPTGYHFDNVFVDPVEYHLSLDKKVLTVYGSFDANDLAGGVDNEPQLLRANLVKDEMVTMPNNQTKEVPASQSSHQEKTDKTVQTKAHHQLPNTGENHSLLGLVGLGLLAIASKFGYSRQKRLNDE
ncbi:pullulanase [Streptococcus pacificus]|uniref:pullulanase n=1 Tax=Streptococcus pacificus TaxID=2740577 RepID=A0ABS0ZGB1_9STRE|nr:pullulanase [Streptococcus pacificus]MBJ8325076.1 pullulanase [Streptococcus pacificus]